MLAINQSLLIIVVYLLFQESYTKENDAPNTDNLENDDAEQGVIFYNIKFQALFESQYITFDFLEPKTYKDGKGNAVLEIPRRFWEGKDLPSLKIHLSQQILKNLSGGEEENHDCEL